MRKRHYYCWAVMLLLFVNAGCDQSHSHNGLMDEEPTSVTTTADTAKSKQQPLGVISSPQTLCEICYIEMGQFGPSDRWTMDFVKSEITYEYSEGEFSDSDKTYCKYVFDKKETEKVIRKCRSFDFSKWNDEYRDISVCDGTSWWMTLKYSDGRQRTIAGKNKWPKTFNIFNTVITNAYFKATNKWPTGSKKIKADIKGGKYNDPKRNYLWEKVN